jgi:hypothetical protein
MTDKTASMRERLANEIVGMCFGTLDAPFAIGDDDALRIVERMFMNLPLCSGEWRGIESAPKDVPILAKCLFTKYPHEPLFSRAHEVTWDSERERIYREAPGSRNAPHLHESFLDGWPPNSMLPTHWAPLPQAQQGG